MAKKLPAVLTKKIAASKAAKKSSVPSTHPAKVLKSSTATAAQKATAARALRRGGKR